ncbi:hypothetical protein ES702_04541 [subsurface metagenome]
MAVERVAGAAGPDGYVVTESGVQCLKRMLGLALDGLVGYFVDGVGYGVSQGL